MTAASPAAGGGSAGGMRPPAPSPAPIPEAAPTPDVIPIPDVIPTPAEIRALHERHAPSAEMLDLVHTHCAIVWSIAEQLLDRSGADADRDLVRAGCLLHDVGVYRLYDGTGRRVHDSYLLHGVLGHELLGGEGLPEVLRRFCSRHTGVGLTRHDILAQRLPLPAGDYVAVTTEERLVMYADKFHSKTTPPRFLTADAYAGHVRRFGEDKVAAFAALRAEFGEPDLRELARVHGHALATRAESEEAGPAPAGHADEAVGEAGPGDAGAGTPGGNRSPDAPVTG